FLGADLLSSPRQNKYGIWYLMPPYVTVPLGQIPWSGVIEYTQIIPPDFPVPLDIPMQALVRKLTNYEILHVE
ncbi:MAG: hypothetical protein ABIK28_17910, partial [Planctomycetota bacterium]